MTIKRLASTSGLALGLALGLACAPELEVIEGDHLRFEYTPTLTPCAGNTRTLDELVPFFQQNLARPDLPRLRYTWHDGDPRVSRARRSSECAGNGCTRGTHAISGFPFLRHELVHAVMHGDSKPFFEEGIAMALAPLDSTDITSLEGPRYLPASDGERLPDPRDTMEAGDSDGVDYATAGSFVAFLLIHHGSEKLGRLHDRLNPGDSLSRIRRVFRQIYGVALDAEVERFRTGVPCPEHPFPLLPAECNAPLVPWIGDAWNHGQILSCEGESVAGGLDEGGHGVAQRAVTLDLDAPGEYVITLDADAGAALRFGPCFGCPWDHADVLLDDALPEVQRALPAGRYYALVYADAQLSPRVGVSVVPTR